MNDVSGSILVIDPFCLPRIPAEAKLERYEGIREEDEK